jgi:hypothetical protein
MATLLTIWGWLLLGAAIGRVLFVRTLADQPRRRQGRGRNEADNPWTDAFTRAVWAGLACVVAWPVVLPAALMLAHTGTEKLRAKRDRLAAEVARLEEQS